MYVFDNSPLSSLFKNFYPNRFPSLWQRLDDLIASGQVTSTREVRRELERYSHANTDWMQANRAIFTTPTEEELEFVRGIFAVPHFRRNIELKNIQSGNPVADPFVIAKAGVNGAAVVTLEVAKPNAAKIPNICRHFGVPCMNLEEFMEAEGWEF